jgi:hypothetical protein
VGHSHFGVGLERSKLTLKSGPCEEERRHHGRAWEGNQRRECRLRLVAIQSTQKRRFVASQNASFLARAASAVAPALSLPWSEHPGLKNLWLAPCSLDL